MLSISRRLGLALVVVLAALTAPAHAKIFNAQTYTLANGLQVVLIEDHRAPVVTQMIWYKAGAADEAIGKGGIAHFLEHLMFKGTTNNPGGVFSQLVARSGGRENAFTAHDYTAYFQTVAADQLDAVLRLEADRMTNLTLTKEQVDSERQVILEERRQVVDNNPSSQFAEQIAAIQYLAYPYRLPIIGWEHEIRGLTQEDALAWYRSWYTPNNAVLVVAGDVTMDQLKPMVEKYYAPIPARPLSLRFRAEEPPQRAERRIEMEHPRVTQTTWGRSYLAPGYNWGEKQHALPLSFLAEVLGGSSTSRLYRSLVVEQKIAVSAGAYYNPSGLGPNRFGVYAVPAAGTSPAEVEAAVRSVLDNLLKDGVTAEEMTRARTGMLAQVVYARDSVQGAARIFGAALSTGRSIEDVETYAEQVEKVTADQVNAAGRAVFDNTKSVVSVLRPRPQQN